MGLHDLIETKSNLLIAVDGAHYVYRHGGLLYVWHGGAIVNIYSEATGRRVDCFTQTKDPTRDNPGGYFTREEIHDSIIATTSAYRRTDGS